MDQLIAWCGFVGAWLLVAGPVYQAALELADQDLRRDELADAVAGVRRPPEVSAWWWLLPPVGFLLHRRRDRLDHDVVLRALDPVLVEKVVDYRNTATGWATVAAGAVALGVKETWELHEAAGWPVAVFWVLVVVMPLAAAANTAVRMSRGHDILAAGRRPAAP